jgi:hypothetical protein
MSCANPGHFCTILHKCVPGKTKCVSAGTEKLNDRPFATTSLDGTDLPSGIIQDAADRGHLVDRCRSSSSQGLVVHPLLVGRETPQPMLANRSLVAEDVNGNIVLCTAGAANGVCGWRRPTACQTAAMPMALAVFLK